MEPNLEVMQRAIANFRSKQPTTIRSIEDATKQVIGEVASAFGSNIDLSDITLYAEYNMQTAGVTISWVPISVSHGVSIHIMVTIQKGGILYDEPIRGISISIVATRQHEGMDVNVFLGQDSESGKCPVGVPMRQWVMDAMRYHISELFDPSLTVPTLAEDYSGGRSR